MTRSPEEREALAPTAALAATVVDELVRGGISDLVLAPGSRSAPVVLAAASHADLRVHGRIDERSAAYLALGLARASGRPAAVLCTSGTAVASLHPAVLEADADGVPLVALTADRPPELRGVGANQTIDQVRLFGRAVRADAELHSPQAPLDPTTPARGWRGEVARLLAAARGGAAPPGPVQLNLGLREPLVPEDPDDAARALPGRADAAPWTAATAGGAPAREVVEAAAGALDAPRGLIIAGAGTVPAHGLARSLPPELETPVAALGRRLGWPVLAEPTAGVGTGAAVVPAPDAVARAQGLGRDARPDVVLRLGRAVLTRPLAALADRDDVPQVAVAQGRWHDPPRTATTLLSADPMRLCEALLERLGPQGGAAPPEWLAAWVDAGTAARRALDAALDRQTTLGEARLARDLPALLPRDGVLMLGSSRPIRDVHEYAAPRDDLAVIGNRGASGIDGLTSTVAGVALGTDRPVTALTGDLSVLHDAPGLVHAGGPRPDAVLVVVDNDGGGIFAQLPPGGLPEDLRRWFTTPHGADLDGLATALGSRCTTVSAPRELAGAVAAARSRGGLQLVRVPTDREATAAEHRALRAEAVAAAEATR